MTLEGQQAKPSGQAQIPPAPQAPAQIWRSTTTGKEYRVQWDNQRFAAEWVNIPPALAQRGAYIRSTGHRIGAKWAGTSRVFLPCSELLGMKEPSGKWCRLQLRIEINGIDEEHIRGHAEGIRKFDCNNCRAVETSWKEFEWVRKQAGPPSETPVKTNTLEAPPGNR